MNDKIREFAEQCKMVYQIPGGSTTACSPEIEKFAELIVCECVRYFNEDYVRDFDVLWREDLSKGMKQHFGVEE